MKRSYNVNVPMADGQNWFTVAQCESVKHALIVVEALLTVDPARYGRVVIEVVPAE